MAKGSRQQPDGKIARHMKQFTGRRIADSIGPGGCTKVVYKDYLPAWHVLLKSTCRDAGFCCANNIRSGTEYLLLYESQFYLMSDSEGIHILRELGTHNLLSIIIERDHFGVLEFSFGIV